MTVLIFALLLIVIVVMLVLYIGRSNPIKDTSNVCMRGKVVIVTGANSGIGFHTAKNLAQRGARVILACRSEARGTAARDSIVTLTGNDDVTFRKLDLSSLKSVREFAANINQTERLLHVLVNNAGVYGLCHYTDDEILEGMQVNYFGHFLLTLLLLPLLKKSQPSRIVNLSSVLHVFGGFDPEKINKIRFLQNWRNYCNSKFCMLMFSVELSRRLAGTRVVANAVHPGVILTGVIPEGYFIAKCLFWWWCLIYNRTVEEAARTVEHLAIAEDCANVSGKYFVDCASSFMLWKAKDEVAAKSLWEYSENLVGYTDHTEIVTKF